MKGLRTTAAALCLPPLLTVWAGAKGLEASRAGHGAALRGQGLSGLGPVLAVCAAVILLAGLFVRAGKRRGKPSGTQAAGPKPVVQTASVHQIGRRSSQQDSFGLAPLEDGVLAVVADGMGGLSDGDQMSQGVVASVLRQAASLAPGQMDGVLTAIIEQANDDINRQLGPEGLYRSGSTVVAALVRDGAFHWISVGDSRVYLYHDGGLLQMNREHTYAMELMQMVLNGEITQAQADSDPQRRGLTSFIGMGQLRYIDASLQRVQLSPGDRVLLLTDGVFNNLPEQTLAEILRIHPDLQEAARALEEQVLALRDPAQDNFTALLLGWQ